MSWHNPLLNGGSFLSLHENVLANAGTLHGLAGSFSASKNGCMEAHSVHMRGYAWRGMELPHLCTNRELSHIGREQHTIHMILDSTVALQYPWCSYHYSQC